MPSQGGALQAIGLNLPQIFINRTIRLQASSYPIYQLYPRYRKSLLCS